jgi:hypothetical protein
MGDGVLYTDQSLQRPWSESTIPIRASFLLQQSGDPDEPTAAIFCPAHSRFMTARWVILPMSAPEAPDPSNMTS